VLWLLPYQVAVPETGPERERSSPVSEKFTVHPNTFEHPMSRSSNATEPVQAGIPVHVNEPKKWLSLFPSTLARPNFPETRTGLDAPPTTNDPESVVGGPSAVTVMEIDPDEPFDVALYGPTELKMPIPHPVPLYERKLETVMLPEELACDGSKPVSVTGPLNDGIAPHCGSTKVAV
jgi:hypothetical protein